MWPTGWQDIPGWFDFAGLYLEQLDRAGDLPSVFVELGSWFGRSTAFMAEAIKQRQAPIQFFAVDTWKGTVSQPELMQVVAERGGDLFPIWRQNMIEAGVLDYVVPIRRLTVEAADLFADGSVDFVFVDADHTFASVSADIRAWLPKLSPRGVIAGHDIDELGVCLAVHREFPKYRTWARCWVVD